MQLHAWIFFLFDSAFPIWLSRSMITASGPNPVASWCLLSWEIQFCLLMSLMCSLHLLLVHRDLWLHTRQMSVQPFVHHMDHVALQLPSCCVMCVCSHEKQLCVHGPILHHSVHGNIIGAARFHPNPSDDILATWSLSPGLEAMNHVCCKCVTWMRSVQFCNSAAFLLQSNRNCSLALQAMSLWAHGDNTVTSPEHLVNTNLTAHMPHYQAKQFWSVGFFLVSPSHIDIIYLLKQSVENDGIQIFPSLPESY